MGRVVFPGDFLKQFPFNAGELLGSQCKKVIPPHGRGHEVGFEMRSVELNPDSLDHDQADMQSIRQRQAYLLLFGHCPGHIEVEAHGPSSEVPSVDL